MMHVLFFLGLLDLVYDCVLLTVMPSSAHTLQSNEHIEEIEEDDSGSAMAWSTA